MTIAALYVDPDGCYAEVEGIDLWDESRDARNYPGNHPVVAHPPCNKWSTLAQVNQSLGRLVVGDDEGCFESALSAVRTYGGVLEHPWRTLAWSRFGLPKPDGSWRYTMFDGGAVCEVDQGWYGFPCRKRTWLYAVGCKLPELTWGVSEKAPALGNYGRWTSKGIKGRAASATPPRFRDLLLAMAESAA